MPEQPKELITILIAGITPYFLERGILWFQEHFEDIRKKARTDPWWRDHTIFLEIGIHLSFSPFLRKLACLGYAKAGHAGRRGEFAVRGGIVDIFPINFDHPIRIEFAGSIVENIIPISAAAEPKPMKVALPKDATQYEKLWLAGLRPGDYMVHVDHGIGIFKGFTGDQNDEIGESDKSVSRERSDSSFSPSHAEKV